MRGFARLAVSDSCAPYVRHIVVTGGWQSHSQGPRNEKVAAHNVFLQKVAAKLIIFLFFFLILF